MGSGLLGVFRAVLVFLLRAAFVKSRISLSISFGMRYPQGRVKANVIVSQLDYEAISLIALSLVGYTIRWTLSFLSLALKDSAHALSQHIPVRPIEE